MDWPLSTNTSQRLTPKFSRKRVQQKRAQRAISKSLDGRTATLDAKRDDARLPSIWRVPARASQSHKRCGIDSRPGLPR